MLYKGQMLCFGSQGYDDPVPITRAVIEKNKIGIDWHEFWGGQEWHGLLFDTSPDGIHFKGKYRYKEPYPDSDYSLTKYAAGEEVLLFGDWVDGKTGEAGYWAFVLRRAD